MGSKEKSFIPGISPSLPPLYPEYLPGEREEEVEEGSAAFYCQFIGGEKEGWKEEEENERREILNLCGPRNQNRKNSLI